MDRRHKDDGILDRPSNVSQKIERGHGDILQVGLGSNQVNRLNEIAWLHKTYVDTPPPRRVLYSFFKS